MNASHANPGFNARRVQTILSAFFFLFGCGGAAWMVRIPELRVTLDISVSVLGIALLIGAVGSLSALVVSSRVIQSIGSRRTAIIGFSFLVMGQLIVSFGLLLPSFFIFVVGSFIAGIGWGLSDVAINMEGTNLEKQTGTTKLPFLHGMYSLGTLIGAGIGVVLIASHVALSLQSTVFACVILVTVILSVRTLPVDTGLRVARTNSQGEKVSQPRFRVSSRVLLLGTGILVISLAEGGAQDWLTLALVQDYLLDPAVAASIFTLFTAGMLVTRFSGDALISRFGRSLVVRVCVALGVIGILIVAVHADTVMVLIAAFLWGVGVALGFPVFISAAGDGEDATRNVSAVTASGYSAFLVGPPLMGFIAERTSLLTMFYVLALLLALAFVFAGATRRREL